MNNITPTPCTLLSCTLFAELRGQEMLALSRMFRLLNEHPQKTLLRSSHLIKYLPNFPSEKNPRIENCKPKKIPRTSLSLKIRSTPLGYNYNSCNITVPKGTECAKRFSDALPNLDLTIIIPYRCSVIQIISFSIHFLYPRHRQNLTLVMSIWKTVPKSFFWAFNCVPGHMHCLI